MKRILVLLTLIVVMTSCWAQSGLYLPLSEKARKSAKAPVWPQYPEEFFLLLYFTPGDSVYTINSLDILDSAYNLAFSKENPQLYTMTIEGYSDPRTGDDAVNHARVEAVNRYFSMRSSHSNYSVRYAQNPIHCSCHGDSVETVRFEVPTTLCYYDSQQLPESRKQLNGKQVLQGCVLVTFKSNTDECLGYSRGCFMPGEDSLIRGYYSTIHLPKGSVYSVRNTLDDCPEPLKITIDEHLDFNTTVERYFLVPHPKQILLQVGYIVLHSNFNRAPGECQLQLPDSIMVRFPATQEQLDNKLRIIAKCHTEKGSVYKPLPTKKVSSKSKTSITIQAAIDASQFDTIFLGKRIKPEELKTYFYEVETNTEEGSFTIDGHHYKAFQVGKHGEYEVKKPLKALFRIVEENQDEEESSNLDGDEQI